MRSMLQVVIGAMLVSLLAGGAARLGAPASQIQQPAPPIAAQKQTVVTQPAGQTRASNQTKAPRTGFDPLSVAEQEKALGTARSAPAVARVLRSTPRTEVLLVERHEEEKSTYKRGTWPRRADVYIYDYDKDELVHSVVDVRTGRVDRVETLRGVQLPLTAAETARAVRIAMQDARVGASIRAQYKQITGQDLARPGEIKSQALIFRADAQPDATRGAATACGAHRCAQLLLSTPNGQALTVLPVIDLSAGKPVELGR